MNELNLQKMYFKKNDEIWYFKSKNRLRIVNNNFRYNILKKFLVIKYQF